MATTIKQISVYNGSAWETANIGVNASDVTLSSNIAGSTNLQTALNNILPASQLAASKIVLTDSNKKLTTSTVSTTELGYLSGTTASIQTQLNGKVAKTGDTMTGGLTIERSGKEAIKFDAKNEDFTLGQTVSALRYGHELYFGDKNNSPMGMVRTIIDTDGSNTVEIGSYNRTSTSSTASSGRTYLGLKTDRDGTQSITVSNAGIWRTGLGVPPTSHASTTTTYGIGTTANYGHVKVVDALNSSAVGGNALSANQGRILNNAINSVKNNLTIDIIRAGSSGWGNYKTTGTTTATGRINLTTPFTNYHYLGILVGANTDSTAGGGIDFKTFPTGLIGTGTSANQLGMLYVVNGQLCHISVKALTTTSLQIDNVYNITTKKSTALTGIRQIFGVLQK